MGIEIPRIKDLKAIALKEQLSNREQRQLILWYIYFRVSIYMPAVMTAAAGNEERFKQNLQIARTYFLTFEDE